jgi:hypothetical protein
LRKLDLQRRAWRWTGRERRYRRVASGISGVDWGLFAGFGFFHGIFSSMKASLI